MIMTSFLYRIKKYVKNSISIFIFLSETRQNLYSLNHLIYIKLTEFQRNKSDQIEKIDDIRENVIIKIFIQVQQYLHVGILHSKRLYQPDSYFLSIPFRLSLHKNRRIKIVNFIFDWWWRSIAPKILPLECVSIH